VKVAVLFSGGKDSVYATHWAIMRSFRVVLATVKPQASSPYLYHRPGVELAKLAAEAMGLPHFYVSAGENLEDEVEALRVLLQRAIDAYGIEGVVSGVLLSDYQRLTVASVADELGLKIFTPLWRCDQRNYMFELVNSGFVFMILSTSTLGLGPEYIGRPLNRSDIENIVNVADRYGFNPAFEGGEAETLVLEAPLFRRRIRVKGYRVRTGTFSWEFRILKAWLGDEA